VGSAEAQVKGEATYTCALPHGQGFVEAVREVVSLFRPDLTGLPWPGPARVAGSRIR